MSEYKQQLSALLDGELSDEEIRRLQPSVEAAEFSTTSRYQLIAEAMRGSDASMIDISNQVRVAILQEATLELHTSTESSATVSQVAASTANAGWFGISWLRPAGGLAVAASVALVLVLAVSINDVQSPDSASLVAQQGLAPQPIQQPAPAVLAQQVVLPVNKVARPNLNSYLKAHSEFAAQDTAQGRMPYARAVTYESRN